MVIQDATLRMNVLLFLDIYFFNIIFFCTIFLSAENVIHIVMTGTYVSLKDRSKGDKLIMFSNLHVCEVFETRNNIISDKTRGAR